MNLKLERFVPPVLILLTPSLLFWRLVFAGDVLYWGLPLYQFYPWHTLVVEAIRAGHLPLWTDLLGNGAPLLANHQSAVFYPLNLIYFVLPVERAMGYSVVLHLALAGLFAYAWGRSIGLSRFGATVTGLSFMLSGFFVARTQFITVVNGAAWLPLLFLLTERLVRRRTPLDAAGLGVALALQFLAGHAQVWFYSLLGMGSYALARAWQTRRLRPGGDGASQQAGAGGRRGPVLALLACALVIALGLSAVQLLPTAELALGSQRTGGLDPDEAMTYSLWPWRLLTLAIPDLFGSPATGDYWGYATYWEDAGYVGVLPLLLALSAVWGWGLWKRQRAGLLLVPFFLLMLLVSLILAMGWNTPVYPFLFQYVPGFGVFRAPARFLLLYTFSVSTLAGIGVDHFRLTYRTRYVIRLTVAGAGAMLVVSLAVGQASGQAGLAIKPTLAPAVAQFALMLGLSAILLLLCPVRTGLHGREPGGTGLRLPRVPLPAWAWRGLVAGLVAADLALFAAPLTPTIDPALYRTETSTDRFLAARADDDRLFTTYDYSYDTKFTRKSPSGSAYLSFSDWGTSDLAHWLAFRERLVPNLNVFTHTASVNNDEPLQVGRWRELMDALRMADWPARRRLLRMMNVGYVLAQSPPLDLLPVAGVPDLYRLPDPLPRAWMVSQARPIPAPATLLSELAAPTFDPTAEVLLESASYELAQSEVGSTARLPSTPVSQLPPVTISLREGWNWRTMDLVVSQPGYLVLAYTYYPGWRATVDGQPTQILRANYALMALHLEAGEHQVVMYYRPVSLILGVVVSGLSALGVIGVALLRAIQSTRSKITWHFSLCFAGQKCQVIQVLNERVRRLKTEENTRL